MQMKFSYLSLQEWGNQRRNKQNHWEKNPYIFQNILEAIHHSSFARSIKTLNIYGWATKLSDAERLIKNNDLEDIQVVSTKS